MEKAEILSWKYNRKGEVIISVFYVTFWRNLLEKMILNLFTTRLWRSVLEKYENFIIFLYSKMMQLDDFVNQAARVGAHQFFLRFRTGSLEFYFQ